MKANNWLSSWWSNEPQIQKLIDQWQRMSKDENVTLTEKIKVFITLKTKLKAFIRQKQQYQFNLLSDFQVILSMFNSIIQFYSLFSLFQQGGVKVKIAKVYLMAIIGSYYYNNFYVQEKVSSWQTISRFLQPDLFYYPIKVLDQKYLGLNTETTVIFHDLIANGSLFSQYQRKKR